MQTYVKNIFKILYENIIYVVIIYMWEYMGATSSTKNMDIYVEENKHFIIKHYRGACDR